MRTKNSIKNLIFSLSGQGIGIIISFISRIVFIQFLGSTYLGIDGLFTNILTVLSLVELGVGPAMTYALYKPLAEENKEKIKTLMNFYKKMYISIGFIILLLGICIIPFYKVFIADVPDIQNLDLIFFLFVVNTALTYFGSYKRTIIVCDQKKYVVTAIKYSCYAVISAIQIIYLIKTKDYIGFLLLQSLLTIVENYIVCKTANKMYPYLKEKNIEQLESQDKKSLFKNISAMIFHKVGGIIVNSTDNIIISSFVGIVSVGLYSNYLLILNALVIITNQFFESIVASIGNLAIKEHTKKMFETFHNVFFMNHILFAGISCVLLFLMNDFIKLWIGNEYLFSSGVVLVIVLNFYLRGIRKSCLTFRDALGIFWYDRYKPIFECLINLVCSIILVKYMGIIGVFIGTTISTVTTSLWVEPYVLYKYGFKEKIGDYFKKLFQYGISAVVLIAFIGWVNQYIVASSIMMIIVKALMSAAIFFIFSLLLFSKTEEYQYYKGLVRKFFQRKEKAS